MAEKRKVLVSGAGIAGPCLAFWLPEEQFEITVVERAPELRSGGQNIDIRGSARELVKRMGLLEKVQAATTGEKGFRVLNLAGKPIAKFPLGAFGCLTNEVEIRRADLARLFYEATAHKASYRFGTSVRALRETDEKVTAEFEDGQREDFDLFVAADGVSSHTRALFLEGAFEMNYLGVCTAYFNIPREAGDSDWSEWTNGPGGCTTITRPTGIDATSVSFNFLAPDLSFLKASDSERKKFVQAKMVGSSAQWQRFSKHLAFDRDFYVGPVSQVKAETWRRGRMVALGDAAYCPTPFTGMGTSLAILGAYVLAVELAKPQPVQEAFANYERQLRPFVEETQKLPPGVPKAAYPKSALGRAALRTVFRLFSSGVGQKLAKALAGKEGGDSELDFPLPSSS